MVDDNDMERSICSCGGDGCAVGGGGGGASNGWVRPREAVTCAKVGLTIVGAVDDEAVVAIVEDGDDLLVLHFFVLCGCCTCLLMDRPRPTTGMVAEDVEIRDEPLRRFTMRGLLTRRFSSSSPLRSLMSTRIQSFSTSISIASPASSPLGLPGSSVVDEGKGGGTSCGTVVRSNCCMDGAVDPLPNMY